MPEIKLVAETGRSHGSASARRLRHAGKIPAVVYGHGIEAMPVAVDARALRAVLSTDAGTNVVVELELAGTQHLAMAKDIQRHPVRGTLAHVDFLVVNRNEVVSVDVPIVVTGESAEIKAAGAVIAQELHTLTVHTTPDRIPNSIEVDISSLAVGASIRVGDLSLPGGVSSDVDEETVVVVGQIPQVELPAEPEAAEGEGEGEAGAAPEAEAAGEATES
jgi:large subunit ribosomal protein L25